MEKQISRKQGRRFALWGGHRRPCKLQTKCQLFSGHDRVMNYELSDEIALTFIMPLRVL